MSKTSVYCEKSYEAWKHTNIFEVFVKFSLSKVLLSNHLQIHIDVNFYSKRFVLTPRHSTFCRFNLRKNAPCSKQHVFHSYFFSPGRSRTTKWFFNRPCTPKKTSANIAQMLAIACARLDFFADIILWKTIIWMLMNISIQADKILNLNHFLLRYAILAR